MNNIHGTHWPGIISKLATRILDFGYKVHTKNWHAMDIENDSKYDMIELLHINLQGPIHNDLLSLKELSPNLPWADVHFKERISGIPYNPAPSHKIWPHAIANNNEHIKDEKFSHTYPERFWPKMANGGTPCINQLSYPHRGIRFKYGDLEDVIKLLLKDPTTRQAYLPIWFPEDTGAVEGQRVPCTIGYHFIIRNGFLDVTYQMRSCDFVRNFRDDVYMACRLGQYIVQRFNDEVDACRVDHDYLIPRLLQMHITSLHLFKSEEFLLENLCQ